MQKIFSREWALILLLLVSLILMGLSCQIPPDDDENDTTKPAVDNLPEGWTHDVLYSNVCASPVGMSPGEDGYMYINDRCQNRILKFAPDETFSEWTSTGDIGMDCIVYQKTLKRLIGSSDNNIYEITEDGTTLIGNFSNYDGASSMIADPENDTIYAVSWKENTSIRLYDPDFNFIRDVQAVDYCLNMALDHNNDILYYTESQARTVSSLNLNSGTTELIRSNLGNGWIDDNLGVTLDDNGTVYYSSFTDGVFRYDPTLSDENKEKKLMDIPLGVGSIFWWSAGDAILQTNVFAGTIVKMDPDKTEAELLEPNVNSPVIAASSDGKVFFYTGHRFYKVEDGKVSSLGSQMESSFTSMVIDGQDNLMVSMDRNLYTVNPSDGSLQQHIEFEDGNQLAGIEYDAYRDEIVALSVSTAEPGSVAIWRMSLVPGSTPRLIITIKLEDSDNSRITVNRKQGDIYFYNQKMDELAKVDEEKGELITLFSNMYQGERELGGLNFFSPLNSFIITYLDRERYLLPLDGSGKKIFCTMVCGMDSSQGCEDANGNYIATHAGKMYRIRPCVEGDDCGGGSQ